MSAPLKRRYLDQETTEIVDDYVNSLCANDSFLCSNRELCSQNSSYFGGLENINKICEDIKKSKICPLDVNVCQVRADNGITNTKKYVNTTFMNIIIPIPSAVDVNGNQKFLRLPPLSGSKIPGSTAICNSCACYERFAVAPGTNSGEESKYTSPGQGQCVYPEEFEYYYYPLDIENIDNTLKMDMVVGKYTVIPENIIYANNNEDLLIENLYDILVRNGIGSQIAFNFITRKLWPNDIDKEVQLKVHIKNKTGAVKIENEKIKFTNDLITFYVIFIIFVIIIIFNLSKSV
jgi:hypothetical protein